MNFTELIKIKIEPEDSIVKKWLKTFVPEEDIFLWKNDIPVFSEEGYLVMPKNEFFNHSKYTNISFNNAYQYWAFSKEVTHIIVADKSWVFKLNAKEQQTIFNIQIELNRGLIMPFNSDFKLNQKYINAHIDNKLVMTNELYNSLDKELQLALVLDYARTFDEWESYQIAIKEKHILNICNSFVNVEGINCFSTTLYAASKNLFIFNDWIHEQALMIKLKELKYKLTDSQEFKCNDILVIIKDDKPIHAAFSLGNGLFLNKNGQMRFNPIKIVDFDYIKKEFDGQVMCYKKIK